MIRLFKRRPAAPEPVAPVGADKVSLHDFEVVVNTRLTCSGAMPGDVKVVLTLRRDGESLPMQCSAQQFAWMCEDDDYFDQVWSMRADWQPVDEPAERAEVGA